MLILNTSHMLLCLKYEAFLETFKSMFTKFMFYSSFLDEVNRFYLFRKFSNLLLLLNFK